MRLWGFRVLVTLLGPALLGPTLLGPALLAPAQIGSAPVGPAQFALGLAAVVAALVVVAAIGRPVLVPAGAPGVRAFARRARTAVPARLADPDAAGRPRPRAPSACPAAG